ncbi:GNAT family N-acetyltransferase [Agromyces sp. G08B096]|uniref:GNAT family N-acetyltransferase n=1 Tax=Agromyces sp. G08B096 TaxID=3156399 RepID=A0AAU7W9E6_9MICO
MSGHTSDRPRPPVQFRAAVPADAERIAQIWEPGWHAGHDGHVPESLSLLRTSASFRERAARMIDSTRVAVVDDEIVGFTVCSGDEIEQVYLAEEARGSGIAGLMLADAVRVVRAAGHAEPWLAVASGNARARRFYERQGWRDAGPFAYDAQTEHGTVPVSCHRYVLPAVVTH